MYVPLSLLDAPIRDYPWGSRTALAQLQGRSVPSDGPEAELWVGAHPASPSIVVADGAEVALDAAIASDPRAWLGDDLLRRFGARLPFLLKVLAADQPLSLQLHPTADQAGGGFAREEERGVPIDAPVRNYRDDWPKPELLRALTPFEALCGFRATSASHRLFVELGVPALAWLADGLQRGDAVLGPAVQRLLTLPEDDREPLVAAVADACARLVAAGGAWIDEAANARALAERYPTDPGVVVALLLEFVRLAPGESIHLPAGNLHAYLSGVGVEIMASSDNVLRGGLTQKHVDVDELLDVLDARSLPVPRVVPVRAGAELVYPSPAPHFRLAEVTVDRTPARLDERGPQLLLCTEGTIAVTAGGRRVEMTSGQAAVASAAAGIAEVAGRGTLFRATVNDDDRVAVR